LLKPALGGTAGYVIAARLSEIPEVTVGVIEAGQYRRNDPNIDIPAMFAQCLEKPEYDWCMYTTPQADSKNKRHHMPRGKVLGGSSAINGMMYVRGHGSDYDDWADLTGDRDWAIVNFQHYFRKHQTLEPFDPSLKGRSTNPLVGEYHGPHRHQR
jgi:choline dehydrogenase-like flavoprotein